jgi:hypothetical protein
MDYPLENLGPERFQQLCQALLIAENSNVQCYPVGMPDGGRDATQQIAETEESRFVIFQVKYSRSARGEEDGIQWLIDAAAGEAEKASRLKARGATSYVFITNVGGTSHLDKGSMDKLSSALWKMMGMPVSCWWRDDIARRLDNSWTLKLRYPDLLTGQDFLRLLLERGDEAQQRRLNALRAFLADQYQEDQEVKFKQVELQNRLLDLFVDLPFSVLVPGDPSLALTAFSGLGNKITINGGKEGTTIKERADDGSIGTATLLLRDPPVLWRLIVEGAPGQGKSTLAQYLCQVHRIRILSKAEDLAMLPPEHRSSPVYLPFKVDLRDLSEWLSGADPFTTNSAPPIVVTERTVEAFIARLVAHKAGGIEFNVNDLIQLAKGTPIFVAFDGLDEVADIKRRAEVVAGVTRAMARIRENCPNARMIVTSRPAAFANSPGFDPKQFPYLQLGSVTKPQISAYAKKWLDARGLMGRERTEFETILSEKLGQDHLRDLSRNPMQLAILLSLIHTRGAALPDKRTALYDAYVDLFFGRESMKNAMVRKHLDLLKDIHRFLAWTLHSRAELGRGRGTDGRLSTEELKRVLRDYLEKENQSTEIVEDVFSAMLERVVMIVSRVEGAHEFEVQPLREYFAARFLYDTASYSPPGREKTGTKPDRFEAIARNPYWLNVTRFFCGCFSKGELLDLADRVKELGRSNQLRVSSHPSLVAAMLLQDYVFTQNPRALKEVVTSLTGRTAFLNLVRSEQFHAREPIRLPYEAGGLELSKKALDLVFDMSVRGGSLESAALFIRENLPEAEYKDAWLSRLPPAAESEHFERWIRAGILLRCLRSVPLKDLKQILKTRSLSPACVRSLWHSGHALALSGTAETAQLAIRQVTSGGFFWGGRGVAGAPFYLLPVVQSVITRGGYMRGFNPSIDDIEVAQQEFKKRRGDIDLEHLDEFGSKCKRISEALVSRLEAEPELLQSGSLWVTVVDLCYAELGQQPIVAQMSASVAWVLKGRAKKCDPFEGAVSPVTRMRWVKSQASKWAFWHEAFSNSKTAEDRLFILIGFCCWAPFPLIEAHYQYVEEFLDSLPNDQWIELSGSLSFLPLEMVARQGKSASEFPFKTRSKRLKLIAGLKEPSRFGRLTFLEYLGDEEVAPNTGRQRAAYSLEAAAAGQISWAAALAEVKLIYRSIGIDYIDISDIAPVAIDEVLSDPENYPPSLWHLAQSTAQKRGMADVRPVATVARREKWFN